MKNGCIIFEPERNTLIKSGPPQSTKPPSIAIRIRSMRKVLYVIFLIIRVQSYKLMCLMVKILHGSTTETLYFENFRNTINTPAIKQIRATQDSCMTIRQVTRRAWNQSFEGLEGQCSSRYRICYRASVTIPS